MVKRNWLLLGVLLLVMCPAIAQSADWSQWRGPDRNGIVLKSPPLPDKWPAAGPKKLWQSEEKVPSGDAGGYGSVTVADGRVYLFVCWKYRVPLTTRTLPEQNLRRLGWHPAKPPADLLKKIEDARVSDERAKLKGGRQIQAWRKKWAETNMDKEQVKKFGRFASDRISRGTGAMDLAVLDKLATIRNKKFESQEELDKWFAANDITGKLKATIARYVPTFVQLANDTLLCVDAATGKTLWKINFPGVPQGYGSSCTPCIANGRCYATGSDGGVYCLDAKTGAEIWKAKVGSRAKNSSFVLVDGVAVIPVGPLTGFDPDNGKVLWKQDKIGYGNSSPAYWRKDGKTYLVCNIRNKVSCVDPKTGDILWSVRGGGDATPAIVGDYMAVATNRKDASIIAYKLSKTKAEKLWSIEKFLDRGASPVIHDGFVYAMGNSGAWCVNLQTGEVAWQKKLGNPEYSSPIVADGKLFVSGARGALMMVKATPDECKVLGKAKASMASCTSIAFAEGKLFFRTRDGIACYELAKKAE